MAEVGQDSRVLLAKRRHLQRLFPGLAAVRWLLTSPADAVYNCHAYALGETTFFLEPSPDYADFPGYYWPHRAERDFTLKAFTQMYQIHRYTTCADGQAEQNVEKIAIYLARDGQVTHTARQIANGKWKSKIGKDVDIIHPDPQCLEGVEYGEVARYMSRRATQSWPVDHL